MVKQALSALKESSSGNYYSGTDFWIKLKHSAKAAGYELVEKSLWLYYAARNHNTPPWAKAVVYSALAYFILPTFGRIASPHLVSKCMKVLLGKLAAHQANQPLGFCTNNRSSLFE